MRTLNGQVEQLQHQVKVLEDTLRRFQADVDARFQSMAARVKLRFLRAAPKCRTRRWRPGRTQNRCRQPPRAPRDAGAMLSIRQFRARRPARPRLWVLWIRRASRCRRALGAIRALRSTSILQAWKLLRRRRPLFCNRDRPTSSDPVKGDFETAERFA